MGGNPLEIEPGLVAPKPGSGERPSPKSEWWEGTTPGRALHYSSNLDTFKKWLGGLGQSTKPSVQPHDILNQLLGLRPPETPGGEISLPPATQRILKMSSADIKPKPLGNPMDNALSANVSINSDLARSNRNPAPRGDGGSGAALYNPLTGSNIMAKRSSFFEFFTDKTAASVSMPVEDKSPASSQAPPDDVGSLMVTDLAPDSTNADTYGSLEGYGIGLSSTPGGEKVSGFPNPLTGMMNFFREGARSSKRIKDLQKELSAYPDRLVNARKQVDASQEALESQMQNVQQHRDLVAGAKNQLNTQQSAMSNVQDQISDIRRLQDIRKDTAQHHIMGIRQELKHIDDPASSFVQAKRQEMDLAKQTMQPTQPELERMIELRKSIGPLKDNVNIARTGLDNAHSALQKQQKTLGDLQLTQRNARQEMRSLDRLKQNNVDEIAQHLPAASKYENAKRGIGATLGLGAVGGLAYWSKQSEHSNPFERMLEARFGKTANLDLNRLVPEDSRTGENIAAGAAGAVLGGTFLPALMPITSRTRAESEALQDAIRHVGTARENKTMFSGGAALRNAERAVAEEAGRLGIRVPDPKNIRNVVDAERAASGAHRSFLSKIRRGRIGAGLAIGGGLGLLGFDKLSPTRRMERRMAEHQLQPTPAPKQVYNVQSPSMLDTMTTPFF